MVLCTERYSGHTVPTASEPNNLKLPGVKFSKSYSSLVTLATRVQEQSLVQTRWREARQALRSSDHRRTQHAAEQMVELLCMIANDLGNLRIAVADKT